MNFDEAFDRLVSPSNEGGYVNNPADPGGETKYGISKRFYPTLNISLLTRADAKAIYLRDFWERGHMSVFPPAVAFQVFDFAVNSGIETAIKKLQKALGVADDGSIGPVTLRAMGEKTSAQIIMLFVAERLDFWRSLSTWSSFGRGWAGRAAADLRYGAEDEAQ